jgi:hypothetical protein
MRKYFQLALGIVAGVLLAGAMAAGIFTATAQSTALGPVMTVTTITGAGASAQIAAANPTRKLIQICVTGSANGAWIAPGVPAVANASIPLSAISTLVATCYTSPPAPGLQGAGGGGGNGAAWFGIPAATPATFTVLEW